MIELDEKGHLHCLEHAIAIVVERGSNKSGKVCGYFGNKEAEAQDGHRKDDTRLIDLNSAVQRTGIRKQFSSRKAESMEAS